MSRNLSGINVDVPEEGVELPPGEVKNRFNQRKDKSTKFIRDRSNDPIMITKDYVGCSDYAVSCAEYRIDYLDVFEEFIDDQ